MLTKLIVDLYVWIVEVFLWVVILASAVFGFHYTVTILGAAGWILENEMAWRICGAIVFALTALLASALLWGPFLLLVDIRRSVKALDVRRDSSDVSSAEQWEPWNEPNSLEASLSPSEYARTRWR